MPMRLEALAAATVPAMSLAGAPVPVPLVFRATMVLSRVAVPALTSSPPPVPPLATELRATVVLTRVRLAPPT
jgi:hypothetical protein